MSHSSVNSKCKLAKKFVMSISHTQGILEISIKPDSRSAKDWKPRLFVLKHYSASGRSSLDYYKNTSKRWQKQSIKGVISLWPNFEISIAHLCSYKFTLKLATAEHTVYLAASNATGMNKWYYFIQTQVKLNPTQGRLFFFPRKRKDCLAIFPKQICIYLTFKHKIPRQ